ncbi:MAG: hypothetical protein DCC67_06290 [Planctomycetota bacterium]|nr:MAG: hypothetical protein DCC67_06290 [Planctomycetota bacterium]
MCRRRYLRHRRSRGAQRLVTWDSAVPGTILSDVPITGLPPGETIRGIDFDYEYSLGHQVLLALGAGSDQYINVYTIDMHAGAATKLPPQVGRPPLIASGEFYGVDSSSPQIVVKSRAIFAAAMRPERPQVRGVGVLPPVWVRVSRPRRDRVAGPDVQRLVDGTALGSRPLDGDQARPGAALVAEQNDVDGQLLRAGGVFRGPNVVAVALHHEPELAGQLVERHQQGEVGQVAGRLGRHAMRDVPGPAVRERRVGWLRNAGAHTSA